MGFIDQVRNFFGFGKSNSAATPTGTIEKAFGVPPAASWKMRDNINLWWNMYTNHPPWESECLRPLDIPRSIGMELARHALAEFSVAVSGSARAEYINEQMQLAAAKLVIYLELGLCLGGVALKPYSDNGRILVDAFTTKFTPTRFDGAGKAAGGVFESNPVRQGKDWFVKLEYHDYQTSEDGGSVYVVENKAFKSGADGGIGDQVPLASVREWADLEPRKEIEFLDGPLFAYFKPPSGNHIDMSSPLGVSVYSGATVSLIWQADEQWRQLIREYKTGKRRMMIDRSVMDSSQADDEIYEYGTFSDSNFFQFINPEIRDEPLYNGFQHILQRIEFNVGLAFGSISDPQSVEKTATEIISAKQRQFVTEKSIQKALQDSLDGLVYAMSALCDLAKLAPAGTYKVDYHWGDGVLDDPESKRQDMAMGLSLLNASIIGPVEYRMRYFGEDEETARKMLPDMEGMTNGEQDEVE